MERALTRNIEFPVPWGLASSWNHGTTVLVVDDNTAIRYSVFPNFSAVFWSVPSWCVNASTIRIAASGKCFRRSALNDPQIFAGPDDFLIYYPEEENSNPSFPRQERSRPVGTRIAAVRRTGVGDTGLESFQRNEASPHVGEEKASARNVRSCHAVLHGECGTLAIRLPHRIFLGM